MCIFLTYPRSYPFEVGIFTSVLQIRNEVPRQSQGHPLLGNITRFYLRCPQVSDELGGLTGLGTQSCSWRSFITMKGDCAKSAEGKAHDTRFGGNEAHTPRVLSQQSHTGCTWFPQEGVKTTHVKYPLPGKLIRDSVLKAFMAGWGLSYRIPKLVFSIHHIIGINRLGIVSPFYQLENGGNAPEIQVLRCQPRANLASRPL